MSRNEQVNRILFLVRTLEGAPHGLTPKDLLSRAKAKGFDVGERTVYRDLEVLETIFPLRLIDDPVTNAKRWVLEEHTRVSGHLVLSTKELFALFLSRGALAGLKQTPFYEDLQSLFKKIDERIGAKGVQHLQELDATVQFENIPQWGAGVDRTIVDALSSACAEGHVLEIEYASANSGITSKRKVGPHFLYYSKGALYLFAQDLKDYKIKTFALARFKSAEMLDEVFHGEPLDPDKYFAHSFGVFEGKTPERVSLLFNSKIGPYVKERTWHSTQVEVFNSNGVQLDFTLAYTPEFIQWVFGFASDCEVLGPESLKDLIRDRAESMIRIYKRAG